MLKKKIRLKEIADEEEIIKWQLEEDRARQHEIYEELKKKITKNTFGILIIFRQNSFKN